MKHDEQSQKEILLNLKKATGTIAKVQSMVEAGEYCVDIATQVNAAIGLLKSVNSRLLEDHLKCCGPKFLNSKNPKDVDDFVKELVRAWEVTNRK